MWCGICRARSDEAQGPNTKVLSGEELRANDRSSGANDGSGLPLQEGGNEMGSEEARPNLGAPLLPVQGTSMRVLLLGREGTGGDSKPGQPGDGGRGDGRPQQGDSQASGASGPPCDGAGRDDEDANGAAHAGPEQDPRRGSEGAKGPSCMAPVVCGAVSSEFVGRVPDGAGALMEERLPPEVSSSNCSLLVSSSQFANARIMQMRAFCSQTATPWNMSMSRFYYEWQRDADEWNRVEGWIPRSDPGSVCLAVFEDDENMMFWSEDSGKVKAVPRGTRKRTLKILDSELQELNTDARRKVVEVVSPSGIQCFLKNEAMANLDPLCSIQFWSVLKDLDAECLFLSPGTNENMMVQACEVAEWQDVRGKVFVMMLDFEDGGWFDDEAISSGSVSWSHLTSGHTVVSNHESVLKYVTEMLESGLEIDEAELIKTLKNQEESHQNTNDLLQNPKAHLYDVKCELEFKEESHQNTDDLLQNSEAHLSSFYYDVCQEHGGSLSRDVCHEHGGSQCDVSSEVYVSELLTQDIEWSSARLLRQHDFSMVSLESLLMKFPSGQAVGRKSLMSGRYLSFGLFAHGNHYGVTQLVKKMPTFTKYLNEVMKYQCKCQGIKNPSWTTIAVGLNAGSRPHRDVHNKGNTNNYILGLGKFRGGGLWTEGVAREPQGQVCWKVMPNGHELQGQINDIHYKLCEFDPKKWHASCDWEGTRLVVSAFTSRGIDQASLEVLREIIAQGFLCPKVSRAFMFDGRVCPVSSERLEVFVEEDEEFAEGQPAQGEEEPDEPQVPVDDVEPTEE